MPHVHILDADTINKIAAGEVVERPSSVVKELVENAIDAGASAVTVEIKDGGIGMIRVTDNGCGIEKEDVPLAFLSHTTSKISSAEDLLCVSSLGFRGEALSSIAAVAQVEMISKTPQALTGVRYCIEGGREVSCEEIGCPSGTTVVVRNLFYNTPARRKFLKSEQTEAGYVSDLFLRLALSHPEISFQFILNRQNRMHTAGNMRLKDVIYQVYGRDISSNLLEVGQNTETLQISGFIGKPLISRGNRAYENYFINGRFIKSSVIAGAIEDAYKNFVMVHKFPFTVLHLQIPSAQIDVNVHPAKMEIRFHQSQAVYELVYQTIRRALEGSELISNFTLESEKEHTQKVREEQKKQWEQVHPEPFETKRRNDTIAEAKAPYKTKDTKREGKGQGPEGTESQRENQAEIEAGKKGYQGEQIELFNDEFLPKKEGQKHKLIGQLFDTYWLVEYEQKLFIIDQHAAHEKVLYEKLKKNYEESKTVSQLLEPPMILSLSMKEEEALLEHLDQFEKLGFEIENFGGREYAVRAVPADLYGYTQEDLFIDLLDSITEQAGHLSADIINDRLATMACKAAIKGNQQLSFAEADALIEQLLEAENPYNCPHGRPTILAISKYELEKKFKRIV